MNTFDPVAPTTKPPVSWYAFKVRDNAVNDAFRVTSGFHPDSAGHIILRSGTSLGTDLNLAMRQFVTPLTPERLVGIAFRPGNIIWSATRARSSAAWRSTDGVASTQARSMHRHSQHLPVPPASATSCPTGRDSYYGLLEP